MERVHVPTGVGRAQFKKAQKMATWNFELTRRLQC